MIITTYRTKKISDDHPYIWRYTARRALVIFDHPYNAEYLLDGWLLALWVERTDQLVLGTLGRPVR